jgi:hypothetical protein
VGSADFFGFGPYDRSMDRLGSPNQSSPGFHPLAVILSLIVAAGLLVVVLPVMLVVGLIGLGLLAILWAWLAVRVWLARAKAPNGALDGRRNVRVRTPGQDQGNSSGQSPGPFV